MYQFLKFKEPIPSCGIYSLEYNEKLKEWTYVYILNTPFELTNDNQKDLIIYEYISDLWLKESDNLHQNSVNLKIKTLDQYLKLLDLQRKTDLEFREKWKKDNPEQAKNCPNQKNLSNKDYSNEELEQLGIHFIANIIDKDDNCTIFAAV